MPCAGQMPPPYMPTLSFVLRIDLYLGLAGVPKVRTTQTDRYHANVALEL